MAWPPEDNLHILFCETLAYYLILIAIKTLHVTYAMRSVKEKWKLGAVGPVLYQHAFL
jgi:hypothetical protein